MRDIAAEVGLRQGGIYNHFASKQELLVDLMRTHMETLLTALDAALDGVEGLRHASKPSCISTCVITSITPIILSSPSWSFAAWSLRAIRA